MVPELPKDFDEFVDRKSFPSICLRCRKKSDKRVLYTLWKRSKNPEITLWRRGGMSILQHPITYRSRKKGGNVHARGYAGLLQKTKEGYVYRYFECYRKFRNGQKGDGGYWELIRITYDRNLKRFMNLNMSSISRQTGFGGVTETDGDIMQKW